MYGTTDFARSIQLDRFSCGPHCVRMVLRHFGLGVDLDDLRRDLRTKPRPIFGSKPDHAGTTFRNMWRVLRSHGLNARWQRTTMPLLRRRLGEGNVVIAHVDGDHVLVVHGMDSTHVHLADPAVTRAFWRRYTHAEFAKRLGTHGLVVRDW